MNRLNALSSALLALAASLVLSACGGTVDFSIDEMVVVDSTVGSGSKLTAFDLAARAGSAWKQRSHISSVSLQSGEVTVAVKDPANLATKISGSVWLLPEGATTDADPGAVLVGTWVDEDVVVGNSIFLTPTAELNTFVRNAFSGSGKFSIYTRGSGTGGLRLACTLHVVLGGKLKWKTF